MLVPFGTDRTNLSSHGEVWIATIFEDHELVSEMNAHSKICCSPEVKVGLIRRVSSMMVTCCCVARRAV